MSTTIFDSINTNLLSLIGSNKIENKIRQIVYNGMVISGVSVILMVSIWQVVIRMYA